MQQLKICYRTRNVPQGQSSSSPTEDKVSEQMTPVVVRTTIESTPTPPGVNLLKAPEEEKKSEEKSNIKIIS